MSLPGKDGLTTAAREEPMCPRRDERQRPAIDLVQRQFGAEAANQRWLVDMTCVPACAGFICLPWSSTSGAGGSRADRSAIR